MGDAEQPQSGSSSDSEKSVRRASRWTSGTLGALVLAIAGSALWEFVFKESAIWIGNGLLTGVALIWRGYLDVTYRQVGAAYPDILSLSVYTLVLGGLVAAILIPLIALQTSLREVRSRQQAARRRLDKPRTTNRELTSDEKVTEIRTALDENQIRIAGLQRRFYRRLIPLTALTILMFLTMTADTLYVRRVVNWIDRSIEIIAPSIDAQTVLQLRSEFRSIKTADDFFTLESKLRRLAVDSKRTLPDFDPVGRTGTRSVQSNP